MPGSGSKLYTRPAAPTHLEKSAVTYPMFAPASTTRSPGRTSRRAIAAGGQRLSSKSRTSRQLFHLRSRCFSPAGA